MDDSFDFDSFFDDKILFEQTIYKNGKVYYVKKVKDWCGLISFSAVNNTDMFCTGQLTNEEYNMIRREINKDRSKLFKSDKLNQIALINKDLAYNDIIVKILDKIETAIPKQYRDTFYKNLETVYIHRVNNFLNDKTYCEKETDEEKHILYTGGTYNVLSNEIEINYNPIIKKRLESESTEEYLKAITTHEIFHMASSSYDKNNKVRKSGLIEFIKNNSNNEETALNNYLNEVLSQYLANKIVIEKNGHSSYDVYMPILRQLISLVGYNTIIKSYFLNKGTILIQDKLFEIIHDTYKASNALLNIGLADPRKLTRKEYNKTDIFQQELLDYYNKKIEIYIENKRIIDAEKLLNSLKNNYWAITINGKRLIADHTNDTDNKFRYILDKYTNELQRKRK